MPQFRPRRPSRIRAQIPHQSSLLDNRHADDQRDGLAELRHCTIQNVKVERRRHGTDVVERVRSVLLDDRNRTFSLAATDQTAT